MRLSTVIFAALMLGLGACQQPEPAAELAIGCQVKGCSCVGARSSFFGPPETHEVLWRDNGEAYCPDGFRLEPNESESKSWITNYGG